MDNWLDKIASEYDKTFPKDFYLWSERGWWLEKLAAQKQQIKEIAEGMKELHTHNSIPSYTDDLEEGCVVCVSNNTLNLFISKL